MNESHEYTIQLLGKLNADDLNRFSPVHLTVNRCGTNTQLQVSTDQSGLIGLLRQIHQRGMVILYLTRANSNKSIGEHQYEKHHC